MKFQKSFFCVFFLLLVFSYISVYSQNSKPNTQFWGLPFKCDLVPQSLIEKNYYSSDKKDYYSGANKPERTDLVGVPTDGYFPILIIFVQFKNDIGAQCPVWPIGQPPVYMNQVISTVKKYPVNGNWWDTYSSTTEGLSDYWMEQSRGSFHVVGKAYSIVLDNEYTYYINNGGDARVNDDIYKKLKTLGINWVEYDKWGSGVEPLTKFTYQPDGYIDMIFKVFRSRAPLIGMPGGGIASLGMSYTSGYDYIIDSVNNKKINGGFGKIGSGIYMTPGGYGNEADSTYRSHDPLSLWGLQSFSEHEFGHYLYGAGHGNYGKMCGDGAYFGPDECLSPYESIFMGYMEPRIIDYHNVNYLLGDYSSRNSNDIGEVLQVPILGTEEFFLIANRRKVSQYDKIMWGDTAKSDPNRVINPEYGKGLYIYHVNSGYDFPSTVDQECADGLFKWTFKGYEHPDWSSEQIIDYYGRSEVSYENDNSQGGLTTCDGKSIISWFSIGKRHETVNGDGTDKVFTNKCEVWTSREWQGDRWDPWNTDYNEIFSPYSSPSTVTWPNDRARGSNNSGIFIWYDSLYSDGTAHLKIYRVDESGLTEDDILRLTPPSKPMGVEVTLTDCINNFVHPHVKWVHNKEPDMKTGSAQVFDQKKYNIYRAISYNENTPPDNYIYVAATYENENMEPDFIDYGVPLSCSLDDKTINVRYKVTAEDMYNSESVKSDFAGFSLINQYVTLENYKYKGDLYEYALTQNYPNPFNPATTISYELKFESNVRVAVYDLTGQQVAELVNEKQTAGRHQAVFNGEHLASGIYFYTLIAHHAGANTSDYRETRKMVLIK